MRAVGKVEEAYPEFYMTTGDGYIPTPGTPDGGSGGNRGDSGEISYVVYEHKETFERDVYKRQLAAYKGSILLICHEPEFYESFATKVVDCSEFCLRG